MRVKPASHPSQQSKFWKSNTTDSKRDSESVSDTDALFFCVWQAGVNHVVLAVSYMSELLEREMRVQEERVSKRRHTDTVVTQ